MERVLARCLLTGVEGTDFSRAFSKETKAQLKLVLNAVLKLIHEMGSRFPYARLARGSGR